MGKKKSRHCQSKQEVLQKIRQREAKQQKNQKAPLKRQLQIINSIRHSVEQAKGQMQEKSRRDIL